MVSPSDGQKFAAFVPVRKDTGEIISAVQAIASDTGIQLKRLQSSEAKSEEGQEHILSLTMDLAGSYGSLRQFLGSLEQEVRLLNVERIEASVDAANPSQLQFTVTANAYYIR